MKNFLVLIVAVLLVGCQSETPAPETKTTPTAKTTPEPEPKKEETPKPVASKPLANPDRVYQLADLKTVMIKVNGHPIKAWVMDTDSKRQEGMMFLKDGEVKAEEGMLFLFPTDNDANHGFWMHNTLIPLDIIYIDAAGKVVSIANGKPKDDTTLKPEAAYRNVVELKGGEAAKLGVKKGSRVEIPKDLKAVD